MSKKADVIAEETSTEVVREPVTSKEIVSDEAAQEFYAKYCAHVNPKHPIPLPSWDQLEDLYKDAWRAVAS